ncbi:MAG: methyltransferase domain-containing protein [Marmoricola sp.]
MSTSTTSTSTTDSTTDSSTDSTGQADSADRELKTKHRTMWAFGDYASVVSDVVAPLGPVLVEATGIRPGDRVLDVAAGNGNASVPAAEAGAEVVASDLTPALLDVGRAAVGDRLPITWQEADAENLPFEDDTFDAVISCLGVMFAPHHQAGADELVRVCRPDGRIGLLSWTPEGFIGQMFATMKPYAPPPPPGAQPPPLWGSEAHVRDLLGDRVRDVSATRRTLTVDRFRTPEEFREFFKDRYGPTIAVYKANADDPERCAALDRDLDALAERFGVNEGPMEWEYLVVTAVRR